MDESSKIRELLRKISGTEKFVPLFRLLEVTKVNGDLCNARIDDFELTDIRLSSICGGAENGLLITPAEGSVILAADLSMGELRELAAIAYSEIKSYKIHQGDTTISITGSDAEVVVGNLSFKINKEKAVFNNGENGMINIVSLTAGLNDLVTTVNNLISAYNTHIHTTTATVGETAVVGTLSVTGSKATAAAEFDKGNYEDTKVMH